MRMVSVAKDFLFLCICLLQLALAGCARSKAPARAADPSPDAQVSKPAAETARTKSAVAAGQRPAVDEQASTDGVPLDLAQVIRVCVLSDPTILVALESVEQARADHTTSRLLPNPTLSIAQTMVPFPGSPFDPEERQGGPPQLDIGVSYSLGTLLFGSRGADMEATQLGVDVAVAEHADVARQRTLEAIVAYYDVLEARELLEIGRAETQLLERVRTVTEQRLGQGIAAELELDQVRVTQFESKRRALREQAEYDKARSRLRAHLGQAPFADRAEAAGTLEVEVPPVPPEVRSALRVAEQHRPDFLALKRRLAQTRAELTREQRLGWPSVGVSAGYTRQFQEQANGFPDANSWGVGLDVSLPIFDRNQGNVAHARSTTRQADLLVSAARIGLRAELEQAIRDYDLAYQLLFTVDEKVSLAARTALGEAEHAYDSGSIPAVEVLASQAAFREVLRDQVSTRAGLLRALHRVNTVVGTALLQGPSSAN